MAFEGGPLFFPVVACRMYAVPLSDPAGGVIQQPRPSRNPSGLQNMAYKGVALDQPSKCVL